MDNVCHIVGADTEEVCPLCSSTIVITTVLGGFGSELTCDCSDYLVA